MLLITLQSCSLFGPTKGWIYDKDKIDAYTQYVPGYYYQSCSGSKKRGTWYCKKVWHGAYTIYHPAEYFIYLSSCTQSQLNEDAHQCDNGVIYASSGQYEEYHIGEYVDFTNE